MIRLFVKEVLKVVGGQLVQGDTNAVIENVSTGRMIKNNALFIDKYKERYNDMSLLARYKGLCIITENPENFLSLDNLAVLIKVECIQEAYWKFVEYYRGLLSIPIIGITGTCGKTTTKEMVKHILTGDYNVCATYKSNNQGSRDIYYLTSMDEKTDMGVFEMGVAYPNDLVESCRVFKPQIRVLLNIGVYHLEGCKTPKEYINAKAKIISGLDENDTLILNADDSNIKKIDISTVKKVVYFSLEKPVDYLAKNIVYSSQGMNFDIENEGKVYSVYIPAAGKHNVYNALAAVAAAVIAGVNIERAIERLRTFKAVEEHLEIHVGLKNATIIDDTWSSAPISVASALESLKEIGGTKKKIALIGISPLLGESSYAQEEYSKIGEKVAEEGIDTLIVVGEQAKMIGVRALELGMKKEDVFFSVDASEIYKIVSPHLNEETIILLKITHRQMTEPTFIELKDKLIGR